MTTAIALVAIVVIWTLIGAAGLAACVAIYLVDTVRVSFVRGTRGEQ